MVFDRTSRTRGGRSTVTQRVSSRVLPPASRHGLVWLPGLASAGCLWRVTLFSCASLCRVRPAAAASPGRRGAAAGLLPPRMPPACLPPSWRAGVRDNRGRTWAPGAPGGGLSFWQPAAWSWRSGKPEGAQAGAPPSPRALPSFQAGCSRQRESSSVRRRAGCPCFCARYFLEGHSGSPRPGLRPPARLCFAAGGQRAGAGFMRPAAVACSRRRSRDPRRRAG